MEVSAKLKGAPVSAQKGRLIADQVRGLPVGKALEILKFSQKKAAHVMRKVLESAIANAENNNGMDIDSLKVSTIFVDEGPRLKRMSPRAKGRGCQIIKPTAHVTIKVSESEE